MFSCGTTTTFGSFQPSFWPFAYASTTGAKSVPPFANRYSTPRAASSVSQASAAVSGFTDGDSAGCSFATGATDCGLGAGSLAAAGPGFAAEATGFGAAASVPVGTV